MDKKQYCLDGTVSATEQKYFRDGTPAPPPIVEYKPKPDFTKFDKPELEKQRYLEKEKLKWIEGVGEWHTVNGIRKRVIPGLFYFCAQEGFVKHRAGVKVGKIERFAATDFALKACQDIQDDKDEGKIGLNVKGRGLGLSTIKFQMINWLFKIKPGCKVMFTTTNQKTMGDLFSEKLIEPSQYMDKAIIDYRELKEGGNIFRMRRTSTDASLIMQLNIKDDDGTSRTAISSLMCMDTTSAPKKAAAFSGMGAAMVEVDDGCLHPYLLKLLGSVSNVLKDPNTGRVDAYFALGGTIEDTITGSQIADIHDLRSNCDTLNMNFHFYPAWMGKYTVNGHADIEYYRQTWEEDRDKLVKSGNTALIKAFEKNYPWEENNVWDLASNSNYEQDTIDHINLQIQKAESTKLPIITTTLVRNGRQVDEVRKPSDNHFHIIERPQPNTIYVQTMDGIATGTEAGSEKGSDCALIMWKLSDPNAKEIGGLPALEYCPVAWWLHRPAKVVESYRAAVVMNLYYNMFRTQNGNMVRPIAAEANAATAEHFRDYLIKEGFPEFIQWTAQKKPFYSATDEMREKQYLRANEFHPKYIQNNYCLPLLRAMLKGKSDMNDSSLMLFSVLPQNYDSHESVKTKKKYKVAYTHVNGIRKRVLYEYNEMVTEGQRHNMSASPTR